ncbi:MAG: SAM-dependent methyltransferase [Deltaproteobacteria bacterium]|nr:SAM-dependent methyltransferase [Deltaproteobacteria bacterium]
MDGKEWTAGRLLGVSGSYWQACTLHAGIELDLFTLLGTDEMKDDQVAGALDCDVRGVTMLLNALSSMGLLVKKQAKYANTDASMSLLVKGSPRYVGYMVMHHHNLVEAWSHLDRAVRTGKPVRKTPVHDEEDRQSFLMGMFNLAMGIAPDLAKQIDLKGKNHLLDLGGGPGTYAIYFCKANPGLKATVYDLPTTRPFAEKTISEFGVSDRIDFLAGDYVKDDVSGAYDVAWLSHVLHGEGPNACRMIIEKTVSVLEPGGLLLIHDFILKDTFDGPMFPALFSLNMLVNTDQGKSYSEGQIKKMLTNAGVKDIRRLPFKGPNESGIISGVV